MLVLFFGHHQHFVLFFYIAEWHIYRCKCSLLISERAIDRLKKSICYYKKRALNRRNQSIRKHKCHNFLVFKCKAVWMAFEILNLAILKFNDNSYLPKKRVSMFQRNFSTISMGISFQSQTDFDKFSCDPPRT